MRYLKYILSVAFISIWQMYSFAQVASDVVHLPGQENTMQISESVPVALSDSDLIIFYVISSPYSYLDTLYSISSLDGGFTWQDQKFVYPITKFRDMPGPRNSTFAAFKTSTGRLLVCWGYYSKYGIIMTYSDNSGYSWSDTSFIKCGSSFPPSARCSPYGMIFNELSSGKIILTFTSEQDNLSYSIESTDNGETWSEKISILPNTSGVSIIEIEGQGVVQFFEQSNYYGQGIYKRVSTDGINWGDITEIVSTNLNETKPRVVKTSETDLWLIYLVEDTAEFHDWQNDVFFMHSSDGGEIWQSPQRFTSYIGDDNYLNAANFNGDPFITFSSTRFTNHDQICYAIPGKTVEKYRPPFISHAAGIYDSLSAKEFIFNCKIIDEEEVVAAKITVENDNVFELFDDGRHFDGDSADYVYGNIVSYDYYPPSISQVMDINNINLSFNNKGDLGVFEVSYTIRITVEAIDNSNYKSEYSTYREEHFYPNFQYEEGKFLFSGGFGLSGYTNGLLWGSAQFERGFYDIFLPGRVNDNPDNSLNAIYTVYSTDAPFGYSWHKWKEAVKLGADFYDGDKNGIYNPVDINYNGIWDPGEDMPDLLGDETAWCVYNDGKPTNQRYRFRNSEPQGIEISQTIFASSKPELRDVLFLRYKITNRGTMAEVLDSVIFSFLADEDIGEYSDDLGGTDTLLNSCFVYNDSSDEVYGINPPAFFTTLLQGPHKKTHSYSDTAHNNRGSLLGTEQSIGMKNLNLSASYIQVPEDWGLNDESGFRNQAKGLFWNGTLTDPCELEFGEVRGGIDCSQVNPIFWFSGDPVDDIGWINTRSSDIRSMLSVGPFTLEKDKPVTIIGAFVLGRGDDPLNSITVARGNVLRAIEEYNNNFSSLAYDPGEPLYPVRDYILYQNYPNPFNPSTTIRFEMPQNGRVTIKIYDILGQEVTTLLDEVRKADRYEIEFNSSGLASGVYIYRMQVNDFIQTKKMLLIK